MNDRMFSKCESPIPEKAEVFLPSLSHLEDNSQIVVNSMITKYLIKQKRDLAFIEKFQKGYCQGFSCVGLYALWLSTQEETREDKSRDDWHWFIQTLHQLHSWHKNQKEEVMPEIDRLIALIEYFQNIDKYLSIAQGDLKHSLIDTMARVPNREYSLAGLFTQKDLFKQIYVPVVASDKKHTKQKNRKSYLLQELIKENRLVLITGAAHEMGVMCIHNMYILFDANFPSLIKLFKPNDMDLLAREIFLAQNYQVTKASPLGFRIFSFSKEVANYPPQETLLIATNAKLDLPHTSYTNNCTGLHTAAWIGCKASAIFYIKNGADINVFTLDDKSTPLSFASLNGHQDIVKLLIESGAKIDQKDDEQKTALDRALENRHYDTAKLFTLFASTNKRGLNDEEDFGKHVKHKNK